MPPLSYVGRNPDSDAILVPKSYADSLAAAVAVTTGYVNGLIQAQIIDNQLQTTAYVDTQDALRAKKATADANDLNYLPATQLNAAGGVAGLDEDGDLIAGQVPSGLVTDRVVQTYSCQLNGSVILGNGATHRCTTSDVREFLIATIVISDPGYPFRLLPFGQVQGAALTPASAQRNVGNNIFGRLVAMPTSGSNQIYGMGICTDSTHMATYAVHPHGGAGDTPINVPSTNGGLTLGLYGSCFYGNGYTFSGTGLVFWALVVPAMGV